MQNETFLFIFPLCTSFVLTVTFLRILIPKLRQLKCGQQILAIGPNWHSIKQGTPTMGGIAFVAAILLLALAFFAYTTEREHLKNGMLLILTLLFALANAIIGFIDDLAKLRHGKNEGLTPMQKLLLQTLVASLYLYLLSMQNGLTTDIYIPFFKTTADLGILYWPLAIVLIVGFVNSVNLTDGLDGLAASVTLIVGVFFGCFALKIASGDLSLLSGLLVGGCFGFLLFNKHPAQVFMGDTGSLFLGAMVVGLAFLSGHLLILFFAGIIYLLEALSDILQVGWYKLTHRRIFRMAPLHHHLELTGLSEVQIAILFDAITLLFSVIAYVTF